MWGKKSQRVMWRSAPGDSKVNISYLSVIHCFITLILLLLSRYWLFLPLARFFSVHGGLGTQQAGGGEARKYSEATWTSSTYKVLAGPAPLLSFEYRVGIQEGPSKKANVAPWRAVYWPEATPGPPGQITIPESSSNKTDWFFLFLFFSFLFFLKI